jgi:cation-transporting ATPase 13A3/4/5
MALVAIIGFACIVPSLVEMGTEPAVLVDKSLDLITITVPPALPATMSAGVAFAVSRLKKKQIFCISPPRVNVSGRIQIMVFDKTGTLTEDGLQIIGIRGTKHLSTDARAINKKEACFTEFVPSIKDIVPAEATPSNLAQNLLLNEAMASCHSITSVNEELIGDPLEIKMFELTDWILDERMDEDGGASTLAQVRPKGEPATSGQNVSIIRRFDFESKLQRMSVIVNRP